jgi:hypothetical protein
MLDTTQTRSLCEKWEPILEGISDDSIRQSTAVLLENQAKSILTENVREHGTLEEATTVGNLGTFQKFAFPLVRRVFPELIANRLVGVQPMQGPVSQIFYLGFNRTGVDENGDATGEQVYSKHRLIYAGRAASGQSNVSALDNYATGASAGAPFNYDTFSGNTYTDDASATVGGQIAAFPKRNLVGPQYFVSAGERLSGSGIPEVNFTIEQQAVTARTRKFRALWTLEASQDLRAYHNLDLERELTDLLSKEVSLEIDRELIEALRNLAYDWNGNRGGYNRDYNNQANANSFAADGMGDAGAPGDWAYDEPGGWNREANSQVAGSNPGGFTPGSMPTQTNNRNVFFVDFGTTALGLAPRHIGEVYSNLIGVINFAAQDIYRTTLRGAGNYIVCSPFVAAMLQTAAKLEGGIPSNGAGKLGASIEYKGKWMGAYDVYVDPLYPEDEILMGYKGGSPMDAGFVYAPYIPLQMLPTITDPETFQPRKGLITRYATAEINPASRFYRIIRIVGADSRYMMTPFAKGARTGGTY